VLLGKIAEPALSQLVGGTEVAPETFASQTDLERISRCADFLKVYEQRSMGHPLKSKVPPE
jgi:hypothetical protein